MKLSEEEREVHLAQVSRRNTVAFEQALKDVYAKISQLHELMMQQQTTIGSLIERQQALEQQLIIQKVQLTGLGPSVRS